ncbi:MULTISPECIES: hypothetical protein [Bacillati]|uniref:hypothetical protein n=1 Tax=Streptomyces goshikiensis TaxID=1942 RepID=UPI0036C2A8C8
MKKWLVILMVSTILIVVPNVNSTKAASGWQWVDSDYVYIGWDLWESESTSKVIYSNGGNFKVCGWGDNPGATTYIVVEEKDGTSSRRVAEDSSHNFYNSCYSFPVGEVDGSNNKAELEFHFERTDSFLSGKNVKFNFYD